MTDCVFKKEFYALTRIEEKKWKEGQVSIHVL